MKSFVIFIIKHQDHMPAITRNIAILILLLTFQSNLWAQRSNWDVSTAPKRCTVIIPSNVNLMLPTNDTYQIGFFVFVNNMFMNVGSATYSSQGVRIELAYSPQNLSYIPQEGVGYKDNQRLITLIRNTSNQNIIYGVEFLYQNDQNKFILDGTLTVQGVRYATWSRVMDASLCQSIEEYEMKIPYGLKPSVNFGTAIRNHQDEDGRYIIDVGEMSGAVTYQLSITSPYITYSQSVYNFNLQYFPVEVLNAHYEICPGSVLTLPSTVTVTQGQLTRTPVGSTTSLTLQSAGSYSYKFSFAQNSCEIIDTVTVSYKENCNNIEYPELIDPITGQEIIFTKAESIRVYDAAMNKVSEFHSPTIWKGTDQNGSVLPPGLYFIIHEDGTTHDVTILY